LEFWILKNAKDKKSNILWKRRKINGRFLEGENKKMQMVEERQKNQI
jgi:hypothetical protein